jgi:GNAT superfamily N-acetyltransferase
MNIVSFNDEQFRAYLDLVDREIRTPGSSTHAWDDFPLLLQRGHGAMALGILEGDDVAAGLSCLVRQVQTSGGAIPVAGIGAVVTRPESRGRGLSAALQTALIEKLRDADVPLAVLWTDQPAIYHRRGFTPAGWEFHVDLAQATFMDLPTGFFCRDFVTRDVPAAAALYARHRLRTLRLPGDAAKLYTMPGTRGLVATGEKDQVLAAVFCGKGSDFRDYVLEWSGPLGLVVPLLAEARRREWARRLLVPPGGELLAGKLDASGAEVTAKKAGHWLVVQPDKLSRYLQKTGLGVPRYPRDPQAILGTVRADGVVVPGALAVAIWGFDSV